MILSGNNFEGDDCLSVPFWMTRSRLVRTCLPMFLGLLVSCFPEGSTFFIVIEERSTLDYLEFQGNFQHSFKLAKINIKSIFSNSINTWNPKHPLWNGCFSWMIPNLYLGNGWNSPLKNGCLRFQVCIHYRVLKPARHSMHVSWWNQLSHVKKGPWLFSVYRGWNFLPSYMGIILSHYFWIPINQPV